MAVEELNGLLVHGVEVTLEVTTKQNDAGTADRSSSWWIRGKFSSRCRIGVLQMRNLF
jgi:hypothetical protein